MSSSQRKTWTMALGFVFCAWLSGCGTPGAPLPPSLNLPDPIKDLSAKRTGNQVTLTWTMPKRNTDRTNIRGDVAVQICRGESAATCSPAVRTQMNSPGSAGNYTETLPGSLASGTPRPINYFVELQNRKGRSAGLSNAATVLAGEAPARIEGLQSELRRQGVVLHWTSIGANTPVRLERKLLTPPAQSQQGLMTPAPEQVNQNFLVASDEAARAMDKTVRLGESYEYRAQRVIQADVNGKTLELDGAFSEPVDVDVKDVFPPSTPTGLVAVATAGASGGAPAIDLSWQPNAEPDLAGYLVYRREEGGEWQRISPATPAVEPAFHDAQVQAGHTFEYAVSAVDKGGHESPRSAETRETVPQP